MPKMLCRLSWVVERIGEECSLPNDVSRLRAERALRGL